MRRRSKELGAYLEHTCHDLVSPEAAARLVAELRAVGNQRRVLSSDFGQLVNGPPVAGWGRTRQLLEATGLSADEWHALTCANPFELLIGEPAAR